MKSKKSMKKYYIVLVILAMLSLVTNVAIAQVVREGNTFSSVKSSSKTETKKTEFTWKDSKGIEYPIYISPSGSCYILRVSKKTNKEYKQYLGKEVSTEICRVLGRTYKSK